MVRTGKKSILIDAVLSNIKGARREMKKYMCTGGHTGGVSHPTTLKKQYRPNLHAPSKKPRQKSRDDDSLSFTLSAAADGKNTVKSAERIASPSRSPTKKKARRQQDLSLHFESRGISSTNCRSVDEQDGGDDDDSDGADDPPQPRILFSCSTSDQQAELPVNRDLQTLSQARRMMLMPCVTPGSVARNDLFSGYLSTKKRNKDAGSRMNTTILEEKTAWLNHCISKLDGSAHVEDLIRKIDALCVEISDRLNLFCREVQDQTTPTMEEHTSATVNASSCNANDELGDSEIGRKQRIVIENSELSRELSGLINDFVTRPSIVNRRSFPLSRCAKIVADSILSFEWTHSEFATKFSSSSEYALGCDGRDVQSSLAKILDVNMKRHSDRSQAAILVDSLWDEMFLDGEVQLCMIKKVRCYLRNTVFTPWKILKAMDLSGFNLSLAGIEVLRRVDVAGKYMRGIIPSKSTILRSARKVEAAAAAFCPFTMIGQTFRDIERDAPVSDDENDDDSDIGEGFEFDKIKVTKTLFEAFGLMDVAKTRPVELGLTSDGAQLTNTISHVAAGLKFNDMALCDPITKVPLFLYAPDSLVQSRNLCFPLRIVIANDNKKTLEGFRPLYNKYSTGEVATSLHCQSFKMSFPGDMKLQWGALHDGGAAKVKDKFCYICPCRSSTLHEPQDKTRCILCKGKPSDNNDECFHYPFMAAPEVREELAEELRMLNSLLVQEASINADNELRDRGCQRMYVRRPGEMAIENDYLDIDYQPNAANDKLKWAQHINEELSRRGMPIVPGTLFERHQRLRNQLLIEQRGRDIRRMLVDSQPKEQAMYLVLQAVVCILHLENRVGLKSIESILRSGISNARLGTLERITGNGVNRRQDEYVNRITRIMRTQILGTVMAPSQWRFPLTEDGIMGTLSMDNNRTRAVMNSIELIIEESISNSNANKERLVRCFPRYRAAMIILRKNTDASDGEIATFQDHIDAWFQDWVHVYGNEGCTNYTHMLSSSHVMRYMQEWKCLHRFSQQGWEALNALIKSYFFRRTNRGGLSKNSTKKTKL